jgi:hypothetical protein
LKQNQIKIKEIFGSTFYITLPLEESVSRKKEIPSVPDFDKFFPFLIH